jgi:hypothetical protein
VRSHVQSNGRGSPSAHPDWGGHWCWVACSVPIDEEPYRTALVMAEFLDGMPRYPKMHPCGELPFQIHTGHARIQGSNPMLLVDLVAARSEDANRTSMGSEDKSGTS